MAQRIGGPSRSLIGVAGSARIRDLVFLRHRRRDERERVCMHIDVRYGRLDRRHMAAHTFAGRSPLAMMSVFL